MAPVPRRRCQIKAVEEDMVCCVYMLCVFSVTVALFLSRSVSVAVSLFISLSHSLSVCFSPSVLILFRHTPFSLSLRPFTLDPFQEIAVRSLENKESVFVSAHTSAGKVCASPSLSLSRTRPLSPLPLSLFLYSRSSYSLIFLVLSSFSHPILPYYLLLHLSYPTLLFSLSRHH